VAGGGMFGGRGLAPKAKSHRLAIASLFPGPEGRRPASEAGSPVRNRNGLGWQPEKGDLGP